MALLAAGPDGELVAPYENGVTRATCPDERPDGELCGAAMTAVRAQVDESGEVIARAHWRHRAHREGEGPMCSSQERMTPWHKSWQSRVPDRDRTEVVVKRGQRRRVADAVTPYGWVVEFQHSGITASTVRQREAHYDGRVLWVIDATEGQTAGVDYFGDAWRWSAVHPWVSEITTMMAVDTGVAVHLLPAAHAVRQWRGPDLLIPRRLVQTSTAEGFTARYVNGTLDPFAEIVTEWARSRQPAVENPLRAREHRPSSRSGFCDYDGDRSDLIYEADEQPDSYEDAVLDLAAAVPTQAQHGQRGSVEEEDVAEELTYRRVEYRPGRHQIRMCPHTGCPSAAHPRTGWCWAHTPLYLRRRPAVAG